MMRIGRQSPQCKGDYLWTVLSTIELARGPVS
jgi:hypothetical protein